MTASDPVSYYDEYGRREWERLDRDATAPPMHRFRARELASLLRDVGLAVETVTALESAVSQRREDFAELTGDHRDALHETVRRLRGDRAVADLSGHILAVGRAT